MIQEQPKPSSALMEILSFCEFGIFQSLIYENGSDFKSFL